MLSSDDYVRERIIKHMFRTNCVSIPNVYDNADEHDLFIDNGIDPFCKDVRSAYLRMQEAVEYEWPGYWFEE